MTRQRFNSTLPRINTCTNTHCIHTFTVLGFLSLKKKFFTNSNQCFQRKNYEKRRGFFTSRQIIGLKRTKILLQQISCIGGRYTYLQNKLNNNYRHKNRHMYIGTYVNRYGTYRTSYRQCCGSGKKNFGSGSWYFSGIFGSGSYPTSQKGGKIKI